MSSLSLDKKAVGEAIQDAVVELLDFGFCEDLERSLAVVFEGVFGGADADGCACLVEKFKELIDCSKVSIEVGGAVCLFGFFATLFLQKCVVIVKMCLGEVLYILNAFLLYVAQK